MFNTRKNKLSIFIKDGFTLVELTIVISILVLLAVISIPSYNKILDMAKEEVCNKNCEQLEKHYLMKIITNDQTMFDQFLNENYKEVCPLRGRIIYVDGEIFCELHSGIVEDDDEGKGEIPYL